MEAKETTVLMFNAELQKETEHTVDIDSNGEIILTCIETGRFVKLPKETDSEGLKAYIAAHKKANEGQVTQASIEARKAELLEGLKEEEE